METEAKPKSQEPGERRRRRRRSLKCSASPFDDVISSFLCFCAEEKADAAVDDWEAIATDEEKGWSQNLWRCFIITIIIIGVLDVIDFFVF